MLLETYSVESVDALSRRMISVSRAFRSRHPLGPAPWRSGHYLIPICVDGQPAHKALVWYHNRGCAWAHKAGCTMCNFGERDDVPFDDRVVDDFCAELDRLDPATRFLHLGPGGSVFQEQELNARLRRRLFSSLGRLTFLEYVGLETRAETVREDRIEEVLDLLPEHVTELALGFGLESSCELILRVAVNKAESVSDISRAIEKVHAVNARQTRRRVVADCYVLLKPIFVTESEAIDDAIRSITWAFDRGVDTVTMFVNTIKENTLCAHLATQQYADVPYRFETPYLYSAFEVLRGLTPDYRSRVGVLGFTSGNPYVGGPRSCDLCWHVLHGALATHNYTRSSAMLTAVQESRCDCRAKWLTELSSRAPGDLQLRFDSYIRRLENDFGAIVK